MTAQHLNRLNRTSELLLQLSDLSCKCLDLDRTNIRVSLNFLNFGWAVKLRLSDLSDALVINVGELILSLAVKEVILVQVINLTFRGAELLTRFIIILLLFRILTVF